VRTIDTHDVWQVLDETRRVAAPGLERRSDKPTNAQARAVAAALSGLFSWLQQHRKVEVNPCANVHRPDVPIARDRVLSDSEIVRFWHACDDMGAPFAQALRLLLLTGARRDEVAEMTRSELSDDGATWSTHCKQYQGLAFPNFC
jgi:integrase